MIATPLFLWLVRLTKNWLRSRDIVNEAGRQIRALLLSSRGTTPQPVELRNIESTATASPPPPD